MSCGKIKRAVIIPKNIDKDPETIEIDEDRLYYDGKGLPSIALCRYGNLRNRSYYLNNMYDWVVVTNDENTQCLVPLRKS